MWRCFALLLTVAVGAPAYAVEADFRLKWFGTATAYPEHDVVRLTEQSPQFDQSMDGRLMLSGGGGGFEWVVHHASVLISGDAVARANRTNTSAAPDQIPTGDERRVMDLTWPIGDGKRHDAFHRFDRLALKYRKGNWAVTLGREAVSWGSGRVFQPMDLFNPFAPTVVDRDFKAGDDLLHAQVLLGNGSDVELLAVGRRDVTGDITGTAGSVAAKLHGFAGGSEYEIMAAKHYRDRVYGLTLRIPIGGALVRTDVVATDLGDGGWKTSGVLNIDYSFDVLQKNVYVFGEYFHNGFGVGRVERVADLPQALTDRLARGETFTLMRDYVALGGNVQWHALLTQNLTVLTNLHDSSSLLQTSLIYDPGDRQRLELGMTLPMGRQGDEYGGINVARLPDGRTATTGGAARGFARWVYYF